MAGLWLTQSEAELRFHDTIGVRWVAYNRHVSGLLQQVVWQLQAAQLLLHSQQIKFKTECQQNCLGEAPLQHDGTRTDEHLLYHKSLHLVAPDSAWR